MTSVVDDMLSEQYEFRDPIHGLIPLNKAEKALIDSEPFQRLRNIKQLGTSYKVYHGAEHTRFGHSIGVMHIVGKIFDSLYNQPNFKLKQQWEEDEFKRYRQITRIAGLLHDLGHGPFSHVGENEKYGLFPKIQDVDKQERSGHEVYSRRIINDVLGDMIDENFKDYDITAEDVLTVLLGHSTDKHHRFMDEMIDGQLDADKMDYLLRDSHHCGVQYGVYDIVKLINSLTICPSKFDEWQLGVSTDGVHVVEEFIFARYWMFLQVYFHKTRRIFDYYLSESISKSYSTGYPVELSEYLKMDDVTVIERLRMEVAGGRNDWAKLYFSRPHLKEAFVSKPHLEEDEEVDKVGWVIQKFMEKYGEETNYIDQAKGKSAKSLININRFLEEGQEEGDESLPAIPVLNKYTDEVFPIQDLSLPLSIISDKQINVLRIYSTDNLIDEVREFCHEKFYKEYSVHAKKMQEIQEQWEKEKREKEERKKFVQR